MCQFIKIANNDINGQLNRSSEHAKPLGVTSDNTLQIDNHVHGIFKDANQKLHALGRLRIYLGNDKSKLQLNAVALSNFFYCPLILLFGSKTTNEMNSAHRNSMRILYRDYESKFEELLGRDYAKETHTKNLQI